MFKVPVGPTGYRKKNLKNKFEFKTAPLVVRNSQIIRVSRCHVHGFPRFNSSTSENRFSNVRFVLRFPFSGIAKRFDLLWGEKKKAEKTIRNRSLVIDSNSAGCRTAFTRHRYRRSSGTILRAKIKYSKIKYT